MEWQKVFILLVLAGTTFLAIRFYNQPSKSYGEVSDLPFEPVASNEVRLITRNFQKDPTNMQALIGGRIFIVDGCVKIGETAKEARTTIWRSGFRVGKDAKGVFVYHKDRMIRYRIGSEVRFGGGYIEELEVGWVIQHVEGQNLKGCKGPFIFVDSTED